MPLSRRYSPEWSPGETGTIGFDFSPIIPPGVGIGEAELLIYYNIQPPDQFANADWQGEPGGNPNTFLATWIGRTVYATLTGGVNGKDYQFLWAVGDTDGNYWNRSALLLCAPTS